MVYTYCVTWQSLDKTGRRPEWVDNFIKCRSIEDAQETVSRLKMKQGTTKDIQLWSKV